MKLTFAEEPFRIWHEEALPLFEAHWAEVALWKDRFALSVDYALALTIEEAGKLACVTARDEAGGLRGYAVFIIARMAHYRTQMHANCDVIYIEAGARQGLAAARRYLRLLKFCDVVLKGQHVERVVHRVKLAHDFGRVLEAAGYVATERTFEKVL